MTTILVVEDDEETLRLVAIMLQRGGYEVYQAVNAESAQRFLEESTPDLIVLDIMLPVTDGIALCGTIRSRPQTTQTPILMLTAKSDPMSVKESMAAGANAYVIKPISLKEFLEKVDHLMAASKAGPICAAN